MLFAPTSGILQNIRQSNFQIDSFSNFQITFTLTMFLQINISELGSFLKYGVTGLSAIAFILTYFLLFRESGRAKPRPEIIKTIRLFMWATIILGVVSGVSAILNPSQANGSSNAKYKKPTVKVNGLAASKNNFKVEIFYDASRKREASMVEDILGKSSDFETVMTKLSSTKKNNLKVWNSQIRYESSEKTEADKIKKLVSDVLLEDGITFKMKQISSNSYNYVSVFVVE